MLRLEAVLSTVQRLGSCLMAIALATFLAAPVRADVTSQNFNMDGEGSTVPTYHWFDPSVATQAVILGLHGGVQHGRNFADFAKRLAPKGFAFYAIDFRGHGEWLTQTSHRPSVDYDATTDDVVKVARELRARHPEVPVYCIGESLGAAVAMKAISRDARLFDGLILVSAGVGPAAKSHVSATFQSIGQGIKTLGSTIDVSPHLAGVSDDERSVAEMLNDPLGRRKSSIWSLLHTVVFLHSAQRMASGIHHTPVLVMLGDADRIVSPDSTRALYEHLGTRNKMLKEFPKAGHLLVTTQILKDEVVATVEEWLSSQIAARAVAITAQSQGQETASGVIP